MSYCHLTPAERRIIWLGVQLGKKISEIATRIGRHKSTVYREIKRNTDPRAGYSDRYAQCLYLERRENGGPSPKIRGHLRRWVVASLKRQWSPAQIAGRAKHLQLHSIAHETIYRFIYRERLQGGSLWKNLRHCRRKRKRRFPRYTWRIARPAAENRPDVINRRSRLGDFERDLIESHKGSASLLTLVDRRSRLVRIAKANSRKGKVVHIATLRALRGIKVRSLTNDNGPEFKSFQRTARLLGAPVYFTRPYASWERGTVENMNGLIRQYVPKQSSIQELTHAQISSIVRRLNNRPRKSLGFLTPNEFHKKYSP